MSGPGRPRSPVALVTGGTRGIGLGCARRLQADGHEVHVTGRARDALAAAGREGLVPHRVDATDADAVDALALELGAVDVLVANAGISHRGSFAETAVADLRRVLEVNVVGVFLAFKAVLPGMLDRGHGRIIAVSSIWGVSGNHRGVAYAASKHAVLGLVHSAAAAVAGTEVTCNAVCPSFTDTPLARQLVTELAREVDRSEQDITTGMLARGSLDRFLDVDEVAGAVAYLASDAARAINGHSLLIDGGWFAR